MSQVINRKVTIEIEPNRIIGESTLIRISASWIKNGKQTDTSIIDARASVDEILWVIEQIIEKSQVDE